MTFSFQKNTFVPADAQDDAIRRPSLPCRDVNRNILAVHLATETTQGRGCRRLDNLERNGVCRSIGGVAVMVHGQEAAAAAVAAVAAARTALVFLRQEELPTVRDFSSVAPCPPRLLIADWLGVCHPDYPVLPQDISA